MNKLEAIRKIVKSRVPDYVKVAGVRQVLEDEESCAELIAGRYSTPSDDLAEEAKSFLKTR